VYYFIIISSPTEMVFCNFYPLLMGKKRRVIPTGVCNLLLVCHFIHAAACAYFLISTRDFQQKEAHADMADFQIASDQMSAVLN
jgi:hypothetical protein